MILFISSCYTMNPDGALNIPQRTIRDIEGRWIGFNENYLLGMRIDIRGDATGTLILSLFDEVADTIEVKVSIQNNIVTLSTQKEKRSKGDLVFRLEPSLMIMAVDQEFYQIHIKLNLVKDKSLQKKIEMLTANYQLMVDPK